MQAFSKIRFFSLSCTMLTASASASVAQTTGLEVVQQTVSGAPSASAVESLAFALVAWSLLAIMGLIIIGIGIVKMYDARAERRATPPTKRIKYSEGIWRILVGSAIVINAVVAKLL